MTGDEWGLFLLCIKNYEKSLQTISILNHEFSCQAFHGFQKKIQEKDAQNKKFEARKKKQLTKGVRRRKIV